MISTGRRGAPLLAGLSAGAVLIAAVVLVAPVGALPIDTALGVPLAA
ncbi:hypothetical protein I4J48_25205, partial [Pseudonocardia sp. KRD-169]|nr:hypothetical protein [Pseudonocardia abyssalis]